MKIKTMPNYITLFRLIMALIFLPIFAISKNQIMFIVIVSLFILLDLLDGYIARKYDQETLFGNYFDKTSDIIIGVLIVGLFFMWNKQVFIDLLIKSIIPALIATIVYIIKFTIAHKTIKKLIVPHTYLVIIKFVLMYIGVILFIYNMLYFWYILLIVFITIITDIEMILLIKKHKNNLNKNTRSIFK